MLRLQADTKEQEDAWVEALVDAVMLKRLAYLQQAEEGGEEGKEGPPGGGKAKEDRDSDAPDPDGIDTDAEDYIPPEDGLEDEVRLQAS